MYPDSLPDLSWILVNDTTTLLGYKCQSTQFRVRSYVAWFASETTIPEGPWKFKGLPSLILQIVDSQNYFNFKCTEIHPLRKKVPIKYYTPGKYEIKSRK